MREEMILDDADVKQPIIITRALSIICCHEDVELLISR